MPPINLASLLQPTAEMAPDRIAVIDDARHISYGTFARDVEAYARALAAEGIDPGKKVGIIIDQLYLHWVVLLAAMRLGAITASLTGQFQERAAAARLDFIVSNAPLAPREGTRIGLIHIDDGWLTRTRDAKDAALPDLDLAGRSLGRIVFTSGTTGVPKGSLVPAAEMHGSIDEATADKSGNTRLFWAYGVNGRVAALLGAWASGGAAVLGSIGTGKDRDKLVSAIAKCNVISTSPAHLSSILRSATGHFPGRDTRIVTIGGAPLPIPLRDEALERLCHRLEIRYSSAESGIITVGDASLLDRHPGAVGYVMPGVELRVVDDDGREVADGTPGKFRIRGHRMVQSYLGDDEASRRFFRDGWFCPIDIGVKHDDGLIVLLGREQDVLNLGGAKFSANVIEHAARQVAGVQDACAVALPVGADRLTCLLLVVAPENLTRAALQAAIAPKLARIGLRNFVVQKTDRIPRNERGKVSRDKIVETILARRGGVTATENQKAPPCGGAFCWLRGPAAPFTELASIGPKSEVY